jgi:hypothetical protein
MLERYYIRPDTIDRIRASWLGEAIERYVAWLTEAGYAARNVFRRVPILLQFAEFSRAGGARMHEDLPAFVKPFGDAWSQRHGQNSKTQRARKKVANEARNPIQQMLRLMLPGFTGSSRRQWAREPFSSSVCGFFEYLRKERGLQETTITHYRHYLQKFENCRVGNRRRGQDGPGFQLPLIEPYVRFSLIRLSCGNYACEYFQ